MGSIRLRMRNTVSGREWAAATRGGRESFDQEVSNNNNCDCTGNNQESI